MGQAKLTARRLEGLQQSDAGHGGGLIVHAFDEDARGGDGDPLRELREAWVEFEVGIVFESEFGVDPQTDVMRGGGTLGGGNGTLGETDDFT